MVIVAGTIGAAVISTILRPLVDKAATVAVDYGDNFVHIEREMSSLRRILCIIEGALPEANEKNAGNPAISAWLRDLDDICYEALDVLDEFVTVAASTRARRASEPVTSNSFQSSVSSTLQTFSKVKSIRRIELVKGIRSLRGRLDKMKEDMETAKLLTFVNVGDSQNAPIRSRPVTSPLPDKQMISIRQIQLANDIRNLRGRINKIKKDMLTAKLLTFGNVGDLFVGREVEKKEIMEKLLNHNDHRVHVVPIWGMGGVGKTTLARSIYNNKKMTLEQYPNENRQWLCVGVKKFVAQEFISKIIGESHKSGTDVVKAQNELIEKLNGKRFLIVLDDIWDIDISQWELFWRPLTHIGKGGVVIITTRNKKVIDTIETPISNDLRPLSDQHCWQIFESRAFINGNSRSDLEHIGKRIAKKLKGLPLAAEVVGRSLSNEPDVQIWRNFLKLPEWKLSTKDNVIMLALRWSYNCLLPHLKLCFAYCSLFPKDHEFDEKMLVEMWMAHGFILNDGKRPEDTGASYFKQLVWGSFFQCVNGKYVMHDLIHDLAMLVSKKEIIRTNGLISINDQMENVRHMCITYDSYFWQNLSLCNLKRLRTLCILNDNSTCIDQEKIVQDIFERLKSIRVLVLVSEKITCIPECIRKLIHLRYLDISETCVSTIPDALCDIYNLQTLAVPCDNSRAVLPKNIMNMSNMRHLRACLSTCKGVKNLTSLQELYSIRVCKDDSISELGDLRQLRGKLIIKNLQNVNSWEDASRARMKEKTHIDHLELNYIDELELYFPGGLGDSDNQITVLDALECPPNLTNLKIDSYRGLTPPNWMKDGELIAGLQSLDLSDCSKLESLPPLGQLEFLKHLNFQYLKAIRRLDDEFYGTQFNKNVFFPSLESLKLSFMDNLEGWDGTVTRDNSVTCFPCLTSLIIHHCPKLVSALPPVASNMNIMRNLSDLEIRDCGRLVELKLDVLVSLKHLEISRCFSVKTLNCFPDLKSLIIHHCPNLVSALPPVASNMNIMRNLSDLDIRGCGGLVELKLDVLVSLKRLKIWKCSNLTRVTSVELPSKTCCLSVKNLSIHACNELMSFPRLVAIEELHINSCEKLSSLSISLQRLNRLDVHDCLMLKPTFEDEPTCPSSSMLSSLPVSSLQILQTDNVHVLSKLFQHDLVSLKQLDLEVSCFDEIMENNWHKLTSLETLEISDCVDLESLPPGTQQLSSLKKLYLTECPKLQALPDGGLPLSLEVLEIEKCSLLLYERCQAKSGLDWHKIKHIRERKIIKPESVRHMRIGKRFDQYVGFTDDEEIPNRKDKPSEDDEISGIFQVSGNLLSKRGIQEFTFDEIDLATKKFTDKIQGFTNVYLGVLLPDDRQIAVKRFLTSSEVALWELRSEILAFIGSRHPNIANILGFCREGHVELMLIYEFMQDRTLSHFLRQEEKRLELNMTRRFEACLGVAKGLAYLLDEDFIHGDIKPSNILLDEDFNPKIMNLSPSKRMRKDMTYVTTKGVGAFGYLDPAYLHSGKFTEEGDVYSYGVVVLELVSGKRFFEVNVCQLHECLNKEGNLLRFVDPRLIDSDDSREKAKALILLELSVLCTKPKPADRPSITKVVSKLEGDIYDMESSKEQVIQENPTIEICSHEAFEKLRALVLSNSLEEALREKIKMEIFHLCEILDGSTFLPEARSGLAHRVKDFLAFTSQLSIVCKEDSSYDEDSDPLDEKMKLLNLQNPVASDSNSIIELAKSLMKSRKVAAKRRLIHSKKCIDMGKEDWKFIQTRFK